jgi:hypothetical protein
VECRAGGADGDDFGMSGRVVGRGDLVPPFGDDPAVFARERPLARRMKSSGFITSYSRCIALDYAQACYHFSSSSG